MNRGTRWERAKMRGAELAVSVVEHGEGVIESLLGGGRRRDPEVCPHGYRTSDSFRCPDDHP